MTTDEEVLTPVVEVIPQGVEVENYNVPGPHERFPLEISGASLSDALSSREVDNLVKDLSGNSDPGKFGEAIAQVAASLGIVAGSLISLKIGGKIHKPAELIKVDGETIHYRYLMLGPNGQKRIETSPLKLVENIEVLHRGQTVAKQEIDSYRNERGEIKGVSQEQIDQHIRDLASGKEVTVTTVENGVEKVAKLKFTRNDSPTKDIANAYAQLTTKAEQLSLEDIPKYGIVLNEAMRKELLTTGEIKEPYYASYQSDSGKVYNAVWKLYIDKDLNRLRFRSAIPAQTQHIALDKKTLIDLVKHLKENGYEKSWAVLSTDKEIKRGITLHFDKNVGGASIVFTNKQKPTPHLYVSWSTENTSEKDKHAFVEKFKPAVAVIEKFLDGKKIAIDLKQNNVVGKQQKDNHKPRAGESESALEKKSPKQKIA